MSKCPHLDKILGLHEPITHRDFLEGALVGPSTALIATACPFPLRAQASATSEASWIEWTGYTGEGDYKGSAGNTEQVIQNAHEVRDKKFDQVPPEVTESGEIYDCVVVGGGFSGLSRDCSSINERVRIATA